MRLREVISRAFFVTALLNAGFAVALQFLGEPQASFHAALLGLGFHWIGTLLDREQEAGKPELPKDDEEL